MKLEPSPVSTPVIDAEGYCRAELIAVTYLEPTESECTAEYRFDFIAPCWRGFIQLHLFTGTKISQEHNIGHTENYNQLTRLFLALGLLSEAELQTIHHSDLDPQTIEATLASLTQQPVRFKFLPVTLAEHLFQIDIDSLQLLDVLV